jgi:hypothetical protein
MSTAVDQMLSDAADVVEETLAQNIETRAAVEALLEKDQAPSVLRILKSVRGAECIVCIRWNSE